MAPASRTGERIDLPRPDLPAYLTASPDEPIGCHYIDGTLFGTGYAFSAEPLERKVSAMGSLERVVIEHADSDHYGALPQVVAAFDPEVVVPEGDHGFLERIYADLEADVRLDDGDTIGPFRAIRVRGHTYGNMSFVDDDNGVLVAGDTVVGADSAIAASGNWSGPLAPPTDRFNMNTERARQNLTNLAGLGVDTILLTHGEDVRDGGQAAIDRLLGDLGLHWAL